MALEIVTGDKYLDCLETFVESHAGPLIEGSVVLKLNPVGLHYIHSRLDALSELDRLLACTPVDYLRAYISDLGDHRALDQLRRILQLLTSLKLVSVLPPPARDPTPLSLLPFGRLKVLELRGCDLSTSAARGLLELRHTLEKLICHNSTDSLRHVFASRIADIKDSPKWNRLQVVSCARNNLVLMDESLQLLPAVGTLDLSRNKFPAVDNLHKCTRLKHLDLGFNHLRTIAPLAKVSCQIVKLVLRNNALTSLCGIENLKSLEGLDICYNIISNFKELEVLASLPCISSLWLEGNPICCARWYRAQMFSFLIQPEKLKLDEQQINTTEHWQRHIIIASRKKQPASYGFYAPVNVNETEGHINPKKKKSSRLAFIENEEHSIRTSSDQGSMSCENDIQSRDGSLLSGDEFEVVDLMNRVELMKKERSICWLRELKKLMDQDRSMIDSCTYNGGLFCGGKSKVSFDTIRSGHIGESLRCLPDSERTCASEGCSRENFRMDSACMDSISYLQSQEYSNKTEKLGTELVLNDIGGPSVPIGGETDSEQQSLRSSLHEGMYLKPSGSRKFLSETVFYSTNQKMDSNVSGALLPVTAANLGSQSSFLSSGSPPHYQQELLNRRLNLEEEILQLSAESFSVASSDSNTSYSKEDMSGFESYISECAPLADEFCSDGSCDGPSHKTPQQ
uniref:Uncharacterized protein n=1 Tax=Kalanchoe fedtschenkoi TaxID=63787 RepID=A0A7N0UGZ6_KALFE